MSLSLGFFVIRNKKDTIAGLIILITAIALLGVPVSAGQPSSLRLLSSDPDGLVIEFLSGDVNISELRSENVDQEYQVLNLPGCQLDVQEGVPMLPLRSLAIGIPQQGDVSFSVMEDEFDEQGGIYLAPGPRLIRAPGDGGFFYEEVYQPDESIYGRDSFFPGEICQAQGEAFLRLQKVLPLVISPIQWNPISRTLRIHRHIVIRVRFSEPAVMEKQTGGDDAFEEVYRAALLNDEQARRWRGQVMPAKTIETGQDPFSTSMDWYRITIRQPGIYRITGAQMSQAGLNLLDVDPRSIKIYHLGRKILPRQTGDPPIMEEIPIWVSGEGDGQFQPEDEILFYATNLVGWEEMSQAGYGEYSNPYTNLNVYWLTYGGSFGDRWQTRWGAPDSRSSLPAQKFKTLAHQERDFLNPDYSGLTWYWDSMIGHFSETEEYRLTLSDVQDENCRLKVQVKGIYYRPSGTVPSSIPHHLYVYLNDGSVPAIERFWLGSVVITAEEQAGGLREGDNVVRVILPRAESEWDHILFDWFEIEYWRGYRVFENQLGFANPEASGTIRYDLDGFTGSAVRLLDISDPWKPVEIAGGTLEAQDSEYILRFQDEVALGQSIRYFVSATEAFQTPMSIKRYIPADLRYHSADIIMITPGIFRQSLEPLAQLHREEGYSVLVANIEDVYDQFAWGLVDPTAIRDYLWNLYSFGDGPLPAYVLLFGDGSFDYKNNSGAGGSNWIPPYENGDLSTDDWFVRLDGDYLADMMIGRLPVRSAEEADLMVGKIVDYVENPLLGPWRNRVMIVADDETADSGTGNELFHTRDSEDLAQHYIPPPYDQHKVYLMEFPMDWSNKKPQAQEAIIDGFNQGMLVVNWIGHGNFDVWAHEDAFRGSNDIPKLANGRRLPLVYSASCDVGRFDHTLNESMSEEFLRARNKGAVAAIGATRSCFATPNAELNKEVLLLALGDEDLTLGQALFGAKLSRPTSYSNDQKYALFGDPCMKLGRPQLEGRILSMSCDTLRALDHISIEGQVFQDESSDTSFSGTVSLQVFDSARPTTYTTEVGSQVYYLLPGAAIFRGSCLIEEGRFEATFVVPKDISYGGRQARISAYFDDRRRDGLAYRDSLSVGGTATAVADTQGPSIVLSIDGRQVAPGDFVPNAPVIMAHLEDENGINITGEVGHWIILLVDGDSQRINVTDRFQYDPGSYQRGQLEYTLSNLFTGAHQVTIKAWDNFNNFSNSTLDFEVSTQTELVLREVLNCPNPFDPRSEHTLFTYQLNRPAEVTIKIYTVAGRLIRTLREGEQSAGYNHSRPWQGDDEDGDQIANGVYLYKIIARAEGERAEAYGKVVVMR